MKNILNSLLVRFLAIVFTLSSVSACGILPASGPYSSDMENMAIKSAAPMGAVKKDEFRYVLVNIDKDVIARGKTSALATTDSWPPMGNSTVTGVSVGDTVSVTIYEAQSGGLFIPVEAGVRPGNYVTIPTQVIDKSGTINIPFAGEIAVAGKSPNEISKDIEEKLGSRAIEPQAIVSVVNRQGDEVSVLGEVNSATKFTLGFNSEKLLDAVARAGGPKYPSYETYVTLQRQGKKWTTLFDNLIASPNMNIFLRPKDTIFLAREAASYQIYGASGANGTYNFQKSDITLSEAMGNARGLDDNLADPAEIYIYRQEKREDIDRLVPGLRYSDAELQTHLTPVIYKLNLREPNGFFLAQEFPINNMDIVYIANSESVEFRKFLDFLNPTSVTKLNTHDAVKQ